MDLGPLVDVQDCAQKCCDHISCEVAQIKKGKCYAMACYTKELCKSKPFAANATSDSILIFMNKRNHMRQNDKGKNSCVYLILIVFLAFSELERKSVKRKILLNCL